MGTDLQPLVKCRDAIASKNNTVYNNTPMDNEGSLLRKFLVSRVTLDMAPLLMIQITIAVLVSWPLYCPGCFLQCC